MPRRYVSIWFRHLTTDWMSRRKPDLKDKAFVLAAPERGRMVVKAVSITAQSKGVELGMVVADCRAILPSLEVFDYENGLEERLLNALAEWCLRYTPVVAIDMPDGLTLDVSGCPHLWGGEKPYLKDLIEKLRAFGYDIRAAMADTIGTAWAVSRYGQVTPLVPTGKNLEALMPLPPAALRIENETTEKLIKLGLYQIQSFIKMPRSTLSRRFGKKLLLRIDQATGYAQEWVLGIKPLVPYQERLPCLEPIRTRKGIEIALNKLLETLCVRLAKEDKGLRTAVFRGYRVDNNIQEIKIGTNRPSRNTIHLFKLFEIEIPKIAPALGIELFILEAPIVEDLTPEQEKLWASKINHDGEIAEFLDRVSMKVGSKVIHRYLPAERHWPENSIKEAKSLDEEAQIEYTEDLPRPVYLLPIPEPIEVMVQLPDYPPLHFIYQNKRHKVIKADGPERIAQEWWEKEGYFRDYYCTEDDSGKRYWLFRLGPYSAGDPKWFIHGFFA
ncbi:MAG: DNA polymerase Y family protein [Bacteroidetes bacterium]|nr:DNA polymerase Y family protein [Bacteroidota bacterium]